ncbi:putative protein kinase RLK-Pelle-Singleton family [Lupinus albus]|uniref:Protein kinase domain-containing protein n=1 Tax=Lupinus albus TaxID=3870 RepID=A0A6A4PR59_LUPAL|nr:putative protein kinase RLK-Pelle-Singleton family [Lupinus albus]
MITIEDVLSAAKEGKVISKGRNWVSYEGKSSKNDMQFMVIEMSDPTSLPLSFWEEIMKFGKVKHPNVVNLIGTLCMSSGKRGFLVYDYSSKEKTLSDILSSLSWERRRKIAVGIAKALKFLHCHCSSFVLVGEVSPEIVLVEDAKGVPRLKVSPSEMACMDFKGDIFSPYLAPEAKKMKEVSEKSAIYGLGVILIELLSGRRSMDTEAGNGMHQNIVEWAQYCYSDCHVDTWIDPVMIKGGDASSSSNQNDIVETMNLALHCTATDPKARPCASEVLTALVAVHTNATPTFC